MPLLALVGALLGLAKGAGGNSAEQRDWKLKSATDKYSPWTKMEGQKPKDHSMIGDILSGAGMGMLMGQGLGAGGGATGLGASEAGSVMGGVSSSGQVFGGSPWAGLSTSPMKGAAFV